MARATHANKGPHCTDTGKQTLCYASDDGHAHKHEIAFTALTHCRCRCRCQEMTGRRRKGGRAPRAEGHTQIHSSTRASDRPTHRESIAATPRDVRSWIYSGSRCRRTRRAVCYRPPPTHNWNVFWGRDALHRIAPQMKVKVKRQLEPSPLRCEPLQDRTAARFHQPIVNYTYSLLALPPRPTCGEGTRTFYQQNLLSLLCHNSYLESSDG